MHHFVLTSRWRVDANADAVWRLLTDIEGWPRWWRHVRQARIVEPGGADHVGRVVALEWATAMPYRLRLRVTTTRIERGCEIEGCTEGDLRGRGLWIIEAAGPQATDITYRWDMHLHRPWMRRFAFVMRPFFEWSHFVVMREGALGMGRALGAQVRLVSEWAGGVTRLPA